MDRKKLLVAGGFIICLFAAVMIISFGLNLVSEIIDMPFLKYNDDSDYTSFNNSTSEATAVSIARLNFGVSYGKFFVNNVYLTDDGKYWNVDMTAASGKDPHVQVIIDAKTLMSKVNYEDEAGDEWNSLDELKANYIAEIQTNYPLGKPQKITMEGKEIWKVPVLLSSNNENSVIGYVYVDLATGKSKNTLDKFKKVSGTDGWLTLKEVDDVINTGDYQLNYLTTLKQTPFRDVLRNLYLE